VIWSLREPDLPLLAHSTMHLPYQHQKKGTMS
jgi:hypothetical protein